MFSISDDLFTAVNNLQTAINKYFTWLNKLNLNLNVLKSSFMIFTRKKLMCPPTLYVNSTSINLVTSQKFLGLILDAPFLIWRKHIEYVKTVCNRRIHILKFKLLKLGMSKIPP